MIVALGVLALIGLYWASREELTKDTPRYEVWSLCLQIIGVAIVGFIIAMATFSLQQRHLEKREDAEQEASYQRRIDDRVQSLYSQTLNGYNEVKRIRRLLEAEAGPKDAAAIPRKVYSRLLTELCIQQLAFESLADLAPIITSQDTKSDSIALKDGQKSASLAELYGEVEEALNAIVDQYQKNWHLVRDHATVQLDRDPADPRSGWGLSAFIYDTAQFKERIRYPLKSVLNAYEARLLERRHPGLAVEPRER
jgi:hypothetical protein